ncbi:protein phosphatase 2C domain-containing protein [Streptomyces sp. NPDC020858]|uniref:protein phosphatase 2C domain-containing protein n=1 Tax=Streptomyces sp. NPDC020858 TaxID=3365097 RepID=UPI0037B9BA77
MSGPVRTLGPEPLWDTLQGTVQGVNKTRNQDHYEAEGRGTAGQPLIMAVADGHGSAAHARSHLGSRFAVDLFVQQARLFAALAEPRGDGQPPSLSWLMHYAEHTLPRQLVSAWQEKALGHWERTRSPGEPGMDPVDKLVLYGSTLVGAVLTPRVFAAWQLGDGELTVVTDDGRVTVPLAPDEADLGDETESLCSPQAWLRVRTHWAPVTAPARAPRLVSVSTDGLSKSFASDTGFRQFMAGLDDRLAAEGTECVRAVLPQWLAKASRHSGDDTTLVAAWHTTAATADPADATVTGDATDRAAMAYPSGVTYPAAPAGMTYPADTTDPADLRDPYRSDE